MYYPFIETQSANASGRKFHNETYDIFNPDHEDRAILQCCIRKQWRFHFFGRIMGRHPPARDNLKSHFPWDLVDVGDGVPSSDP